MGTSSPTAASRPIYSIDLFCGPGGLATGLRWAGIRPVIAVEWSDRTVETYSENHGAEIIELEDCLADRTALLPYLVRTERPVIIHGDNLVNTLLRERFGLSRVDLVTGGAPCESFSMAGDRKVDDSRNQLYQNVLRIARAAGARMFLFENVKGLFSKRMAEGARPGSMYEHVCDEFEEERDGVAYRLASRDPDEVLLHAIDRRLDPDKPSFTVTSHCLDEMIHPYQDRGLTPREAARLQSFPDWYAFSGPYMRFHGDAEQDRYEQIGDAIPPLLAYALGRELAASLSGRDMPEIRIEEQG